MVKLDSDGATAKVTALEAALAAVQASGGADDLAQRLQGELDAARKELTARQPSPLPVGRGTPAFAGSSDFGGAPPGLMGAPAKLAQPDSGMPPGLGQKVRQAPPESPMNLKVPRDDGEESEESGSGSEEEESDDDEYNFPLADHPQEGEEHVARSLDPNDVNLFTTFDPSVLNPAARAMNDDVFRTFDPFAGPLLLEAFQEGRRAREALNGGGEGMTKPPGVQALPGMWPGMSPFAPPMFWPGCWPPGYDDGWNTQAKLHTLGSAPKTKFQKERAKAAAAAAALAKQGGTLDDSSFTTVMLRGLPKDFSRDALLELLDSLGFESKYDFVYMPTDFKTWIALGYAFVNLVSVSDARLAKETFAGFKWPGESGKVCAVKWCDHQGTAVLVERFRNSAVMHESVPEQAKPVMFTAGKAIEFPGSNKVIKMPRCVAYEKRANHCPRKKGR